MDDAERAEREAWKTYGEASAGHDPTLGRCAVAELERLGALPRPRVPPKCP